MTLTPININIAIQDANQVPMQDAKLQRKQQETKKKGGRLIDGAIANTSILQTQHILRRQAFSDIQQRRPHPPMQHTHMRQSHRNPLDIVLLLRHGRRAVEVVAGVALGLADAQRGEREVLLGQGAGGC